MLWIEDLRRVHPGPFVEIMRIVYVFITLKQKGTEMLLNTILNHVQKFKGFVFKKVQWANPEKTEIDVLVEARANSQPRCSQCGRKGLRHGRQPVRYLQAGIMADGVVLDRLEGTPQGSPLSPLLANVLLDEVDKELERRGHKFARYADDANVYVRSQRAGERVLESLRRLYAKLHLKGVIVKSGV